MSNPQIGDSIVICGYNFTWTKGHLSKDEIEPLRYQYDTLATAALERLQAIRSRVLEDSKKNGASGPPHDLYAILRDHHGEDEILDQFWSETHTVPEWVDWDQLERGQKFFYRYAIANVVGFALQGFMAENSAAPGVVEVLVRTGGFSTRVLLGRLLETFQWLLQVTHDLDAIKPTGEGHIATVRVRLLHASVRQRLLHLSHTRTNYFDSERYGTPINLLDGIHSISTFCCNPMWLQLPKFGITPSADEVADYIALFRYLGFLLGTPTSSYFGTAESAKLAMESFLVHEVRTTQTSRVVAFNFVECVTNLPRPFHVSRGFVVAGSRWINGGALCDELELERPALLSLSYLCFGGHCLLVTLLAWLQRRIPGFDEVVIHYFRRRMYQAIVRRKSQTRFEFKYIPRIGQKTGKEAYRAAEDSRRSGLVDVVDIGLFEVVLLLVVAVVVLAVGGVVGLVVSVWRALR